MPSPVPGRLAPFVWVIAILATACTSGDEPASTTEATSPGTATSPTTATSLPQTVSPTPTPSTTTGGSGLCGIAGVEPVGIGDAFFPELGNPGYDVVHYLLDLDYDPVLDELTARAAITATAAGNLDRFHLDFARLRATSVEVDGADACFAPVGRELFIVPEIPLPAGERFTVTVEYEGSPGPTTSQAIPFGIGWQNSGTDQSYVVAEPDAAHTWFPSNDHPLDKATFTYRITVPTGVTAAANGELVETVNNAGTVTWVWEMDDPMATYLATVVIGDFDIVEDPAATEVAGVPIRHVLPAGTGVEDWPGLETQGEMLAFFAELFGPYPFDEYGIAIVDGFGAALENQTLSLFDSRIATSGIFEIVLVHEVAHQWFGNSVSPGRWEDIWLNEGFASYAEWLWTERAFGFEEIDSGLRAEAVEFSQNGLPPPGRPPATDLFNAAVYRVGAMTLHALRLAVGDDAFFVILQIFSERFAGGTATTADFVAVAEEVAGRELDDLFDAWLYEESIPGFPAS